MREVGVRKIFDDGRHNAFTDLVRWQGAFYLTFRSAIHHMSRDGCIRILRSMDGEDWAQVKLLSIKCDDGDPKVLSTPEPPFLYSPG